MMMNTGSKEVDVNILTIMGVALSERSVGALGECCGAKQKAKPAALFIICSKIFRTHYLPNLYLLIFNIYLIYPLSTQIHPT